MKERDVEEKDIPGYEGIYTISPNGDVHSYHKERRKLKPYSNNKHGYLTVRLVVKNDAVVFTVHQLVANAFLNNPNNYNHLKFKDGDKTNVHVDNLEWGSEIDLENIPKGCTWVKGFEGEYYFNNNLIMCNKEGKEMLYNTRGKKQYIHLREDGRVITHSIDRLIEKTFHQ